MEAEEVADSVAADAGASGADGSAGSGASGAVSSTTPARPAPCPGTVAAGFTVSGAAGLVAAGPASFPARPGSAVPLFPGAEVSVAAGASTGDCAISGAAQRRAAVSSRIRSRFMVDAYGFRTEPPKRGVPYCKDSPRSTLPMQAKSCSDGCKRLWMSGVLLKKSCDRGRRTCRLRTRPASGRSACLLRRSGIRPPPDGERRGIAARMLRVAARRREVGYCRPAVEGRRPPGPRLSECPPVRVSPSALRSAPLRSEPVRTCSAPSRPASPGAMRRSAAAPRARRCPIRRCAA